jgi:hypothetical protein
VEGIGWTQYDRGRSCKVFSSSLFSTLDSTNSFFPFSLHVVFSFALFLTAINLLMLCFYEKNIAVSFVDKCFGV